MKSIGIIVCIALFLLTKPGHVEARAPYQGEQYEITNSYETSQRDDGGSLSNSEGRSTLVERVIGARDGGLELEYDLPQSASADDRAREWTFPARILLQQDGTMVLLNGIELEARLERWLQAAGWTREVCGRWIFTWTAFHIVCDPVSVIDVIAGLDLRSPDLREGAVYRHVGAREPGTLRQVANGPEGARFVAVMAVDPDAFRRARAESDVVVGEIMQHSVTLDAALRERARERISGSIEVTFETDAAGNARRRTTVTRLETDGPGGQSETETRTEIIERRSVPDTAAHQ